MQDRYPRLALISALRSLFGRVRLVLLGIGPEDPRELAGRRLGLGDHDHGGLREHACECGYELPLLRTVHVPSPVDVSRVWTAGRRLRPAAPGRMRRFACP